MTMTPNLIARREEWARIIDPGAWQGFDSWHRPREQLDERFSDDFVKEWQAQSVNWCKSSLAKADAILTTLEASDADTVRLERAEAAQLNLYRQAEHDRELRKRAEEAFGLIAPFAAKFAAAVPHYSGGRPRYPGTTIFHHDPEPGYRPALTTAIGGPTGNGTPPDGPTLNDLRMLADAYEAAQAMLTAAHPKPEPVETQAEASRSPVSEERVRQCTCDQQYIGPCHAALSAPSEDAGQVGWLSVGPAIYRTLMQFPVLSGRITPFHAEECAKAIAALNTQPQAPSSASPHG